MPDWVSRKRCKHLGQAFLTQPKILTNARIMTGLQIDPRESWMAESFGHELLTSEGVVLGAQVENVL